MMARFEKYDDKGTLTETYVVSEDTLRTDPEAVITVRLNHDGTDAAKKTAHGKSPSLEGYDYLCSVDGDPDAAVTNCVVHVLAKKGSYEKEKPSKVSGLRAQMKAIEESKAGEKVNV
jgi:hypothetical protein